MYGPGAPSFASFREGWESTNPASAPAWLAAWTGSAGKARHHVPAPPPRPLPRGQSAKARAARTERHCFALRTGLKISYGT